MIKVITYGTFDLFHYGHYNLLYRASKLGDYLIVGVSSDEMCRQKGKAPVLDEAKRIEIVSNIRFVDKVIVEKNMAQKVEDIKREKVDIFLLGSDYDGVFQKMAEYQQLIDMGVKVIFLERTEGISTTDLKNRLKEQETLDLEEGSLHNITR